MVTRVLSKASYALHRQPKSFWVWDVTSRRPDTRPSHGQGRMAAAKAAVMGALAQQKSG
jgi:hypothetical protein